MISTFAVDADTRHPVRPDWILEHGRERRGHTVAMPRERGNEDCGGTGVGQVKECVGDERWPQQVHPEDCRRIGHAGGKANHVREHTHRASLSCRGRQLPYRALVSNVADERVSIMTFGPKLAHLAIEVLLIHIGDHDPVAIAESARNCH